MAHTDTDLTLSEPTPAHGLLGLTFEDQRTGEVRQVVYADAHVVLVRDATNHTTMESRDAFELALGTRYRARPDADPSLDGGPAQRLRDQLAAYEREDGRKAAHKAAAIRESLDLFAPGSSPPDAADSAGSTDGTGVADDSTADREVPLEEVPGIGPKTAGNLRTHGFVTESEVRGASDDELLGVAGLGPENLATLREFVE